MSTSTGTPVPPLPIQALDPHIVAMMSTISPGAAPTNQPRTIISYEGIDPDGFTDEHRDQIQALIDGHGLSEVLEIINSNGCQHLVDRATQGARARCDLSLDDEAMASFDNLVPGLFVYELMVRLAVIGDPTCTPDPGPGEMFHDFSRKGYALWGNPYDPAYLPYTWADVKTLLTF